MMAMTIRTLISISALSTVCPDSTKTCGLPTTSASAGELQTVLQIVFGIVGALALLMIVISGLRYVLSGDNPDRAGRARSGIVYALVGLVIALTAEAIVTFVIKNL